MLVKFPPKYLLIRAVMFNNNVKALDDLSLLYHSLIKPLNIVLIKLYTNSQVINLFSFTVKQPGWRVSINLRRNRPLRAIAHKTALSSRYC